MMLLTWVYLFLVANAVKVIKTSSLLTCMDDSEFTATNFDVVFYPDNRTVYFTVAALSTIPDNTYVEANVNVIAYGLNVLEKNFSFCDFDEIKNSICPFQPGHIEITNYQYELSEDVISDIPGIAYTIPDLDARVRVLFYSNTSTDALACVEAVLSNGKSVQTKYASWPIAAVSGLGVITSTLVSLFGYSATAAHIASNSASLFVYFQSLAIIAMQAVDRVPPIAAAWAQNFQWSLGIIKVGFMQDIANWYVQSTGGDGTQLFEPAGERYSISVQKRSMGYLESLHDLYRRQLKADHLTLFKRLSISLDKNSYGYDTSNGTMYTTDEHDDDLASKILVLKGMQRVAYLAGIEITSFFMTSIMFLLFVMFCIGVIWLFAWSIMEILVRAKKLQRSRLEHVAGYSGAMIKGSLYRLFIISLPQVVVMCVWQFFERDSAGTIVFAAVMLLCWLVIIIYSTVRVVITAARSLREQKNPAAYLYGNYGFLYKFGMVYIQYRADRYWWIPVSFFYVIFKSLMVATLQSHGKASGLIVFIVEFIHFIAICVVRPYMDTSTNAFNIILAVVNTINALFFAFFSNIFTQPAVVSSIMAIVYFILNAVVALVLLLWTIITCVWALFFGNNESRYRPVKDDRVSFLPRRESTHKRRSHLFRKGTDHGGELDALGATAMKARKDSTFHRASSSVDMETLNRAPVVRTEYPGVYSQQAPDGKFYFVDDDETPPTPPAHNNGYEGNNGYNAGNGTGYGADNGYAGGDYNANPYDDANGYDAGYNQGNQYQSDEFRPGHSRQPSGRSVYEDYPRRQAYQSHH
ncbi:flavin carrier protein 2 [Diutina catenulata]